MDTVVVSPKYQIVIPKRVRESLGILPGQRMRVLVYKGQIVLVPVLPVQQMRGFLRGMDAPFIREEADRI